MDMACEHWIPSPLKQRGTGCCHAILHTATGGWMFMTGSVTSCSVLTVRQCPTTKTRFQLHYGLKIHPRSGASSCPSRRTKCHAGLT